ncbi:hypothetical protein PIB30_073521 [Stylosanthes scabra]|uniref:Uncharacterized protein n=1 Tax=Stylosanthes scabra TaxID=79078 RepID=A0ABU6ZN19_9FABA|nr:hypothetical protein [Stylosanthes scabra]
MAFRIPGIRKASLSASKGTNVPKGYLAVYVGDKMRRFVIPLCYLNQPSFQELLNQAEEESGYDHPTGGLTIPCSEDEREANRAADYLAKWGAKDARNYVEWLRARHELHHVLVADLA